MIITNVDNCIERFYDNSLDFNNQIYSLFPRISKLNDINQFGRYFRYITAKMASCFHPEAKGFVYAFNFKNKNQQFFPLEFAENVKELTLDKIGMSSKPNTRKNKSERELPFINLEYDHTIAMFPTKRYGGAKALEDAILLSMPDEDHQRGEWFHSSLGVWRTLLRWHLACFWKDIS